MRFERTREETIKDKALLLVLFAKVHLLQSRVGDRLKMQKLAFLLNYPLFQGRIKGLNLTFFTYRWGPFTKDLYDVETDFEVAKLMDRVGKQFKITETGLALASQLEEAMRGDPENGTIFQALDQVVETHGESTTKELLDLVHNMQVVPLGWQEPEKLDSLPLHLDLTAVLSDEESNEILEIDQGWLDSLAMVLDSSPARLSG